jgi:uncharacterized protein YbcI
MMNRYNEVTTGEVCWRIFFHSESCRQKPFCCKHSTIFGVKNHYVPTAVTAERGSIMMGRGILKKTCGQLESEISDAVTRFEKELTGRGPLETRTYILEDMIIVRQKGTLGKAELSLVKHGGNDRIRGLIKQMRNELMESNRPLLEDLIRGIMRRKVRSLFTDLSTVTGEKIIIFTLDRMPEFE